MDAINYLSAFSSVGISDTMINTARNVKTTAVEIELDLISEYKRRFPRSNCVNDDAYRFIYENYKDFDCIISCNPCQSYSSLQPNRINPDRRIVDLCDFLFREFHGKWVIENVESKWLRSNMPVKPVKIGRHPFFSNVELNSTWKRPPYPENFNFTKGTPKRVNPGKTQTQTYIDDLENWLGVKLSRRFYIRGNHDPGQIYREATHPELMLYVFDQVIHSNVLDEL